MNLSHRFAGVAVQMSGSLRFLFEFVIAFFRRSFVADRIGFILVDSLFFHCAWSSEHGLLSLAMIPVRVIEMRSRRGSFLHEVVRLFDLFLLLVLLAIRVGSPGRRWSRLFDRLGAPELALPLSRCGSRLYRFLGHLPSIFVLLVKWFASNFSHRKNWFVIREAGGNRSGRLI